MTELLLSLFTCTPYGGAACAGVPKAATADVAAATGVGGGTAACSPPPWLTIVPRVSLLGGRATAAAAPLWSSSIVVVVAAGGPVHCRWVSWTESVGTAKTTGNVWIANGKTENDNREIIDYGRCGIHGVTDVRKPKQSNFDCQCESRLDDSGCKL